MSQQCPYDAYKDEQCAHPVYKDHGYCIFHSSKVAVKKRDFQEALDEYIAQCEKALEIKYYNFAGFIFPTISFIKKYF